MSLRPAPKTNTSPKHPQHHPKTRAKNRSKLEAPRSMQHVPKGPKKTPKSESKSTPDGDKRDLQSSLAEKHGNVNPTRYLRYFKQVNHLEISTFCNTFAHQDL